jgi:putative FmdB family regulatory protein
MPIYEYACAECETHFEKLVHGAAAVACPQCQSPRVNRLLSLVGVRTQGAGAPAPASGGPGGCCGGGCGCR